VLFDLYYAGYLSLSSLLLTLCGAGVIIAFGILLRRLKVFLSLKQFAFCFILLSLICLITPAFYWLPLFAAISALLLIEGLIISVIVRGAGLHCNTLSYHHSPGIAFAGTREDIASNIKTPDKKFGISAQLFRRMIMKYMILRIDGTDSAHCVIPPEGDTQSIRVSFLGDSIREKIPVLFILRGHDRESTLFASLSARFPFSLFVPWRQQLLWKLPEIPILSSTYTPLAGQQTMNRIDEKMKKRPIKRESRIRTEAFLHLGAFSPGEPLSQVDFRASLRAGEIISRKYSHTIEMNCMVAFGFGRRARASSTGEILSSALGRVITENVIMGIGSEVCVFDMVLRSRHRLGTGSTRALSFGAEVAQIQPSHYEEDELCILEGMGQRIRDYTHLRIIIAWGGSFDPSRAIELAMMFKKNGTQCEIQIIAPEVIAILNEQKDAEASKFFAQLMDHYTQLARSAGITILWSGE
jgi:hypothetical protein